MKGLAFSKGTVFPVGAIFFQIQFRGQLFEGQLLFEEVWYFSFMFTFY